MIPAHHWVQPAEQHVTSQCLGINGWTCEDCAAEFCRHFCHRPEVTP